MSLILALDTTAAHCAVALVSGRETLCTTTVPMTKGQAEHLFPIIEQVLNDASLGYSDLDAIAVATGPGNFTGVRICVSAARGLGLSLKIPTVGVSVLEALAFEHSGNVVATVDARGGTIYSQLFSDGVAQGAPVHSKLDEFDLLQSTALYVGFKSEELAERANAASLGDTMPKPETYGLIAQTRDWSLMERPVPLYIREADAALPSEAPPVIIP